MAKYPKREALRRAHDIYHSAMTSFIFQYLEERVEDKTVEALIMRVLNRERLGVIDIKDIPTIFRDRECWNNFFLQRFGYDWSLRRHEYDIRSVTSVIVMGRNRVAHQESKDLPLEYTRMHLFLIADVLAEIGKQDDRRTVEVIRDELVSDDTAEAEKSDLEKRLKTMSDQLEAANAEKTKYEKALKAASNQLATLKRKNAQLEERLETTSAQLEDVGEELADSKERLAQLEVVAGEEEAYEEDFAELEERLPLGDNAPDSITFHGTIFTRHLNKYHVAGDDISQGFWHYWQSQGREGKQGMRDAGWSVEKVDGDWEVTISPEDFQAWIVGEITELNNLLGFLTDGEPSTQPIRPSSEKISLPAVKEMVKPALTVLADGKEHRRVEIIDYLAEHFSLTADEREYLSKTGQSEKHLMNKGLIERTRTGYYRITTLGLLSSGTRS